MNARFPELPRAVAHERFPLAARARAAVRRPPVPPVAASRAQASAPAALGQRHNWPLYLFLVLLPLQNIQTGYLPNFGGGLNFLNVFFAVSLVGAWVVRGGLARGEPLNFWTIAFSLYAVASLFIGYGNVTSTEEHLNILKDQLLGLYMLFLVQMSVSSWSGVRRVLLATLIPLPYIAWVTWNQHASVAEWHYSDDLRIQGTFALLGANEFAAFCVSVAIVLFAVLVSARLSRIWQLMLAGGIAAMVMGVLYAYSRTGYVSLILGLVTVVLVWRKRWKLIPPLLLAVALLPALLPYSVVERFDSTTVEEGSRDKSTDMRFRLWNVAWDNFLEHPLVGTGYHTFHHPQVNPYEMDTHNLYMRTLSEGGLVGAAVLLGLLLAVLRGAWRTLTGAQTGSLRYALALGVIGAWVAVVCANLFGDRFTYFPMMTYFWTYVALVVKARHLPPEGQPG